jgi:hypothetical protein
MKKGIALYGLLLVLCSFYGCFGHSKSDISGNNSIREERIISGFIGVVNYGPYTVHIIQDSVSKVVIEAEKEVINKITTTVKNSKLNIYADEKLCFIRKNEVLIYVHLPSLNNLTMYGSGNIFCQKITTEDLILKVMGSGDIKIDSLTSKNLVTNVAGSGSITILGSMTNVSGVISGSGDIFLSGNTIQEDFKINGSGSIRAVDMIAEICYAKINGSGDIFVNANKKVETRILGSGDIFYKGSPEITLDTQGSRHISKIE